MGDDSDRESTIERDISHFIPPGHKAPRHAYIIVLSGSSTGAIFRLSRGVTTLGRAPSCDIQLADDGVSRRHARLILRGGTKVQLEDLGSTNGLFAGTERIDELELRDGDRFSLGDATLLKFSLGDEFEERFQRKLYQAAILDELTGVHNRKHFADHLAAELSFSQRHGSTLSLLMIDIDHFKQVNDTRGHRAGDEVLREVGQTLRRVVRTEDVVARFGGEEFVVLARGITEDQTEILAERLRSTVERLEVPWEGRTLGVTISVGIACFGQDCVETAEELIELADQALYRAKAKGRNRISRAP